MDYTYFGKKAGLNRTKDLIIAGVCIFLYILFFIFMVTPPGKSFFDFIKKCMPFMNLIDGTLSDINRLFGLVFEKFGLGASTNTVTEELHSLSFVTSFFDLSKLMVSSAIQSVIFFCFSIIFLNAKNTALIDVLLGASDLDVSGFSEDIANKMLFKFQNKKDILYWFNSTLLLGISILLGGLLGNAIMHYVSIPVLALDIKLQFWVSLLILLVIYVLFSIFFMIKSIKSVGISYSFRRSLIKTLLFNLIPEALIFFVTNIVIVITFTCFVTKGIHILSVLALIGFILWTWISDKITDLLHKLFTMNIPFMGKTCPFSGLLWLPSTVTLLAMMYIMMVPNMDVNSNQLEISLTMLPFLNHWVSGVPVFDMIISDLGTYIIPLLNLLVLYTFAAAIQYFTSSYLVTLYTQVIIRALFAGFIFVFIIIFYMILTLVCYPLATMIEYKSMAIVVAVFLYVLFAIYQPFLVAQSIFSTALTLLLMQWLPGTLIALSGSGNAYIGRYLGGALVVIGIHLLFSLLQNIATVLEKKLPF